MDNDEELAMNYDDESAALFHQQQLEQQQQEEDRANLSGDDNA